MSDSGVKQSVAKKPVEFVHLHNHSHYSLLDGLSKVAPMLDRAIELGMGAIGLTDHGTLSGAIEFYQEAKKRGIKPIVGVETYVAPRGLQDKTARIDANPYHLILLAKNRTGYHNLMKLTTIAHLEGFYYKPRVDRALLEQHAEGLIALSACASGEVARHILNDDFKQAEETILWYQGIFGEGNYYLELQDHEEWPTQAQINKGLLKLHDKTGVPLVVTADSHYCLKTDREAHEVLLCVQTGKTMGDTNRMEMEMDLFVTDPAEIAKRWGDQPEALANTAKIAAMCDLEIEFGQMLLPVFEVPTGETQGEYLRRLSFQGLAWRYGGIAQEDISQITEKKARTLVKSAIVERLEYELLVIAKMGYESYFLIVADFVNWGKNQGIIFGPGRGSAAGSILSYALNVTDLDPVEYNLMFERFLNPDRISMPDIDIDIQDNRRQEVIDYVTEKYGEDRVAQIITFGTMAARNAVRDTGRALGMAYGDVDRIAKLIPPPVQGRHIPLEVSIKDSPELRGEYHNNPTSKRLIDLAMRLEGTIRSNGVHAAGVVIGPEALVNFTPMQRAQKGGIATQYSMGPIEELGLLKMDFLGLSNLTIIKNSLRIIRKVDQKNIDLATIPRNDKKTFELLARGDTTGVFQMESAGMKRYLRELKPTEFKDVIAMVALYRPGPMAELPRYIEGKNDHTKVKYLHPALEEILKDTYGVIVYQEQIIMLLQLIAGYTPGQADLVRKAIGKKKRDIMKAEYPKFIAGSTKQGLTKDQAEELWGLIQPFADYSFNKSHAACYALIAYQTAYLKAHHQAAFMAALLTSDHDNIERIAIEVAECQRLGIAVLPPDVNESFLEFGVMPGSGSIRFGMGAIKNLGVGAIESILDAREKGGEFKSVEDFARRVDSLHLNKKAWESLIKSGALDGFGDRGQLLFNLDLITGYASKYHKNALSGQIDIFGALGAEEAPPQLQLETAADPVTNQEKLGWEKEHLGLYLSHHPLDDFEAFINSSCRPIGALKDLPEGQNITIGGVLTTVKKIITRNNAMMAFCGLADKTGEVELVVFPKTYEAFKEVWEGDRVVQVQGKVSFKTRDGRVDEEVKVLVDQAVLIDHATAAAVTQAQADMGELPTKLTIKLPDLADAPSLLSLKQILSLHPGTTEAFISLAGDDPKMIRLPFRVTANTDLVNQLAGLFGADQILIET